MSARLAVGLWMAYIAGSVAWAILLSLNEGGLGWDELPFALVYGAFATVGAIVAARRPDNSIGWLFLAIGLGTTLGSVAQEYAVRALVSAPGSLAFGPVVAWVGSWMWGASIVALLFPLVLFPDGRPANRYFKSLFGAAVALYVIYLLSAMFAPGPLELAPSGIDNPFGIREMGDLFAVLEVVGGNLLLPLILLATLAGLFARARRTVGVERQQLRWFGYGALFLVLINFGVSPILRLFVAADGVENALFGVALTGLPVTIGVAVLRYRLYDIDVIVNRTLVYGALSAILAGVYLGVVFLLQGIVAGVGAGSDLVVAASTLAVAALFNPLRRRIQALIDHYFYRRKYDAQRTIEEFSARLRDGIDLDALSDELVGVVETTMQPRRVSLWLRHTTPQDVS